MKAGLTLISLLLITACSTTPDHNSAHKVYVYKYDGSVQCRSNRTPISLAQMERELTESGIAVYERCKYASEIPVPAVCGHRTGQTNTYLISESDYAKAQQLGFHKPLKSPRRCIESSPADKPKRPGFLQRQNVWQ